MAATSDTMWKDRLVAVVESTQASVLRPAEFLIGYNGVPMLVYDGFSESLLKLKDRIVGELQLPHENSGSLFPKTTLGALKKGTTLSLDDLLTLRRICDEMNIHIEREKVAFDVGELAVVVFLCRSLENRLLTHSIGLRRVVDEGLRTSIPPDHSRRLVRQILDDFALDNLPTYLSKVVGERNHEEHYRSPWVEATLIYQLPSQPTFLETFEKAVDEALPGRFAFFRPASRHVTIRALTV